MSKSSSRRKWLCVGCRVDTGRIREHYMLVDAVWFSVHHSKFGMYCIGCFEDKLGRKLTKKDFAPVHVNNPKLYEMSLRLVDRLNAA